jgi:undecaprenyl-diphosphatase
MDLTSLLALDSRLFALVNTGMVCGFLDAVMPFITDLKNTAPLLGLVYLYLLFGRKGELRVLALMLAVAIGAADTGSSRVLKKLFQRKRPCCVEPGVRTLIGCKTSKSFPSSHAANTAAVAGVIACEAILPVAVTFVGIAAIVSFSRIYVGVHYPLDVTAGMLFGFTLGALVATVLRRRFPRKQPPDH